MENYFLLFPIVFMLHEMEEIIGFKRWFEKNMDVVKKHRLLEKIHKQFSTEGFAMAVLEEYILCIVLTGISFFSKKYIIWIGFFIAFSIHLAVHIIQCVFIKRYIPALISSIILLPISLFLIGSSIDNFGYHFSNIAIVSALAIILLMLNLLFAHWIMKAVTKSLHD